ncbi:thioesterase family protein [Denitratisoma oestradiolicum]|uniref:4-hydroxybenzoyl-CoA thioesterase n=1 Tax=Denitratisoma oestradiolicum TaxID=311182 RepID=A0A6S6Y3X5_9PROT|nr:thioesterase family protein [Denitratisoma oestradiolicum]TWO80905.1 hypothetical protein CBW56_07060 [Denitratisoma oestradiolicum]CAB1367328.1 4-hydroxybenzoyl-CoA thioesterase [Denitratisoma oestradiolicum]
MISLQTPYVSYQVRVPAEWIDVNGHMNATRYHLVVYEAHYRYTQAIGLGDDYVARTHCGKAVLESHMRFEQEVSLGDELEVRSWLLAVDAKRLHFFHEVMNLTTGRRAAAGEQVDIHIDLQARKSAPLPEAAYAELQRIVRSCLVLPKPPGVGSRIRPPVNPWFDHS